MGHKKQNLRKTASENRNDHEVYLEENTVKNPVKHARRKKKEP